MIVRTQPHIKAHLGEVQQIPKKLVLGLGLYRSYIGIYRDNGKEHGNYYIIIRLNIGIYRDNGKETSYYYVGFRDPSLR